MVSMYISRVIIMVFGTLYPAYRSYKAIKNKEVREYVKWMMYWIVFAFFTTAETFADMFISWLPLYYEIKIVFLIWLLSPATKGSSILYRRFVHPRLMKHEKKIDKYIDKAKENSYATVMELGRKGLNVATDTFVKTAISGQATLVHTLRKYSSLQELTDSRDVVDSSAQNRTTWYGGMTSSVGLQRQETFDPENDVAVLQRQYKPDQQYSEYIHEQDEGVLERSQSDIDLTSYDSRRSLGNPPSPRQQGGLEDSDGMDDPDYLPPQPRRSASPDGGQKEDPNMFNYQSNTLPRVRKPKPPLYESNPSGRTRRSRRSQDRKGTQ